MNDSYFSSFKTETKMFLNYSDALWGGIELKNPQLKHIYVHGCWSDKKISKWFFTGLSSLRCKAPLFTSAAILLDSSKMLFKKKLCFNRKSRQKLHKKCFHVKSGKLNLLSSLSIRQMCVILVVITIHSYLVRDRVIFFT